jgi:hypothetical protein
MAPLILPSRPITTFGFGVFEVWLSTNIDPKAAVNFTTSIGDSVSPGFPPIVPLIPDMLLINATMQNLGEQKYGFTTRCFQRVENLTSKEILLPKKI